LVWVFLLLLVGACSAQPGAAAVRDEPRSPPEAVAAAQAKGPTLVRIQGNLWVIGLPHKHGWARERRVLLTRHDAERGVDLKVGVVVVLDDSYATAAPVGIVYEEPGASFDGARAALVGSDQRLRVGRGFGSLSAVVTTTLVEITLGSQDEVGVGDVYEVRSLDGRQVVGRVKVTELEATRAKAAVLNAGAMMAGQEVVYQPRSAAEEGKREGLKIVVCNFTPKASGASVQAGETFAFDLAKHLREAAASWQGLEVLQVPQLVGDHEPARALGRSYQADIVVWGAALCMEGKGCAQPVYTVVDPARLVTASVSGREVRFDPLSPGSAFERGSAKDPAGVVFGLLGSLAFQAQHYGDAAYYLGRVPEGALVGVDHFRALRDLGDAQYLLGRIESALDTAGKLEREARGSKDRGWQAVGVAYRARILTDNGQVDEALKLLQEVLAAYEALGDRSSRAMTLGYIARILTDKGQVDEALKLHRETLATYEGLGAQRDRAIALSDIARILTDKGQVDEALKLLREALAVYEALGDRRTRAVTLGDIARILTDKGQVDEALKLLRESLAICEVLGERRGRAVTLSDIARILYNKGQMDEALKLLHEALAVYEALGNRRSRALTLRLITHILKDKGQMDEALKLYYEALAVYDALGDRRSRAVTLYDVAKIHLARNDIPAALPMLRESYKILLALGDARGTAFVGESLAQRLIQTGAKTEAEPVVDRAAEALTLIGETADAAALRALISGTPPSQP
jgi:tetratricopeptide (TPR) repeat protein